MILREQLRLLLSDEDDEAASDEEVQARRRGLLRRCGPPGALLIDPTGVTPSLWCAVRVGLANDSELQAAALLGSSWGPSAAGMLGPQNELAAAGALARTLAGLLGGYGTSDAEDARMLAATGPGRLRGSARAAVELRLREKQLLINAINLLRRDGARLRAALGHVGVSPDRGFSAAGRSKHKSEL